MRIILQVFLLATASFLSAAELVGVVTKVEGGVSVSPKDSIKRERIKLDQELYQDSLVSTSRNAHVVIKLVDDSVIALDAHSSVHFPSLQEISQEEGRVYYSVSSRDASGGVQVKTPFSIIGIKGTQFIVNSDEANQNIQLKEGLIGVEAIKGDFELYRKKVQQEFDAFLSKQQSGFEEFKKAQMRGFAEKVKEFDLKERHSVSFDGAKVVEKAWTQEDDEAFEYFESLVHN